MLGRPRSLLPRLGGNDAAQGNRAILAKRLGPSESEPIEAKPSLFGPTKRQPLKSQPGRAAKRPLASGCPPHGSGPGACLARRPSGTCPRRALGLGPGQAPRPSSARALAWFWFPATQPTDREIRPGKRRKAPKPDRQPGQSCETTAKTPPDPWEPAGLAVPGWRAAEKGPAGQATRPLGPAGRPIRLGSLSSGGCWSGCKG